MKMQQTKLNIDENILRVVEETLNRYGEAVAISSARKAIEIATQYQNDASPTLNKENFLSYLLYIFPRTFLANKVVFRNFSHWRNTKELSILDLGCGLAPATLAMLNVLEIDKFDRVNVYLNDLERKPLEIAGKLICKAFPSEKIRIHNLIGDYTNKHLDVSFDAILLSFSLEELSSTNTKTQLELIAKLQKSLRGDGKIFITHPADKRRSTYLMRLRNQIPEYILAPCTHARSCPLLGKRDWCYFTFEWAKPHILQNIFYKLCCDLPDVKFSYLVISKEAVIHSNTEGRIINRILNQKGVIQFKVCDHNGITNRRVLKRELKDVEFSYQQNDIIRVG